jgi:hypothetical protein
MRPVDVPVDTAEFDRLVALIERLRRLRRIKRLLVALAAAGLIQGCATCEQHPALCTVAAVIVVAGVAAVASEHAAGTSRIAPGHASIGTPPCPGPTCT